MEGYRLLETLVTSCIVLKQGGVVFQATNILLCTANSWQTEGQDAKAFQGLSHPPLF